VRTVRTARIWGTPSLGRRHFCVDGADEGGKGGEAGDPWSACACHWCFRHCLRQQA